MSYEKNKQQAFQAAEHGLNEVKGRFEVVKSVQHTGAFGREMAELKNEVSEATQQIQKALEECSHTQHGRLNMFQAELATITDEMNQLDQLL